jgi:hypothetical protein
VHRFELRATLARILGILMRHTLERSVADDERAEEILSGPPAPDQDADLEMPIAEVQTSLAGQRPT